LAAGSFHEAKEFIMPTVPDKQPLLTILVRGSRIMAPMKNRMKARDYGAPPRLDRELRHAASRGPGLRPAYYWRMRIGTPLFPLPTVLFPEGPLPLRVFEPRYVDMVGRCMREDEPFGVIRIQENAEASGTEASDAELSKIGTLAIIADWFRSDGGLLGILAIGSLRFQLHSTAVQPDGLRTGNIEELPPERQTPLPPEFISMSTALQHLIQKLDRLYQGIETRFDDASWVGLRLAEILPIGLEHKQHCLELEDPVERLRYLRPLFRFGR